MLSALHEPAFRIDLDHSVPPKEPLRKRRLSRDGLLLIKSLEGFRPRAVHRRDGVLMIGYGHLVSAREGVEITEAEAELLLLHDLIPIVDFINLELRGPVNQNQFDALASFIFNIGLSRFRQSDVLTFIRKRKMVEAAEALAAVPDRRPPASDLPYRRRCSERALFETPDNHPVTLANILTAPILRPDAVLPAIPDAPLGQTGVVRHEDAPATTNGAPARRKRPLRGSHNAGSIILFALAGLLVGTAAVVAFKQGIQIPLGDQHNRIVGMVLCALGGGLLITAAWTYGTGRRSTARS